MKNFHVALIAMAALAIAACTEEATEVEVTPAPPEVTEPVAETPPAAPLVETAEPTAPAAQ